MHTQELSKRWLVGFAAFGLLLMLGAWVAAGVVYAGAGHNTTGWAWGGTPGPGAPPAYQGMGWISFNSSDCDTNNDGTIDNALCGAGSIFNYGVNIPSSNTVLDGLAWSEHYGFISFNSADLGGCPQAPCEARRSGNNIVGWARILAIPAAGGNAGGFTGWISLNQKSGAPLNETVAYGLDITKMTGTLCTGVPSNCTYAWSEDLGWIEMSGVVAVQKSLIICPATPVTVSVGGAPAQLNAYYWAAQSGANCSTPGGQNVTVTALPGASWSSSDDTQATVADGLVTGQDVGSPTITATYDGLSATKVVTVDPALPTCGTSNGVTIFATPSGAAACGPGNTLSGSVSLVGNTYSWVCENSVGATANCTAQKGTLTPQ